MTVIEKVLSDPWPPSLEVGREVPQAVHEEDCVVSLSRMCLKQYADMEFATRNVIVGSLGTMISNNLTFGAERNDQHDIIPPEDFVDLSIAMSHVS